MIRIRTRKSANDQAKSLLKIARGDIFGKLDKYGREGVAALASATPIDSGRTANSWDYRVTDSKGRYSIEWFNTNVQNGANVAILLQYGHGTGTGGYVAGRDYINPAIRPIFDRIADNVWAEIQRA